MEGKILLASFGLLSIVVFGALSGCLFFQEIDDGADSVIVLNIDVDLKAETDVMEITSISGNVNWPDYRVLVDGIEFTTTTIESSAGEPVFFTEPQGSMDLVIGIEYSVKVVHIEENKIVYDNNINAE